MDRNFENGASRAHQESAKPVVSVNWQDVFYDLGTMKEAADINVQPIVDRYSVVNKGGGYAEAPDYKKPQVVQEPKPGIDIPGEILREFEADRGFGTFEARIEMAQMRVMERMKGPSIVGA